MSWAWIVNALNLVFLLLGLTLVVVAIVAKSASLVTTLAILDGVLVMGIFLMITAIVGIVSVVRKFNAGTFIYMVGLALLFVTHFGVSIAALVVPPATQQQLAASGWCRLSLNDKNIVQDAYSCNGFLNSSSAWSDPNPCVAAGDSCGACAPVCTAGACPACYPFLAHQISTLLKRGGGVSLAFSLSELLGLWAVYWLRKSTKFAAKGSAYKRENL